MALSVPQPISSFDQLSWLFPPNSNLNLDASIYQDDDEEIMEFSDSSGEYSSSPYQGLQPVSKLKIKIYEIENAFITLRRH